ncbi:MAG: hypothetical protein HQL23_05510 [Candidatus Omnitrophica bacterium]|nr:hypothetical protein [Candidatus Omnitrophota bacterium]
MRKSIFISGVVGRSAALGALALLGVLPAFAQMNEGGLVSTRDIYERSVRSLRESVNQIGDRNAELRRDIAEMKRQIPVLQKAVNEFGSRKGSVTQDVNTQEKQLQQTLQEYQQLEQASDRLAADLSGAAKEEDQLQSQWDAKKKEQQVLLDLIAQRQNMVSDRREELKRMEQEQKKGWAEEDQRIEDELKESEKAVLAGQRRYETASRPYAALTGYAREKSAVDQMVREADQTQKANEDLTGRKKQLEKELAEVTEQPVRRINQLDADNAKLISEKTSLQTVLAVVKSRWKHAAIAPSEPGDRQQFQENLDVLQKENASLRKKLAVLKRQVLNLQNPAKAGRK